MTRPAGRPWRVTLEPVVYAGVSMWLAFVWGRGRQIGCMNPDAVEALATAVRVTRLVRVLDLAEADVARRKLN